VLPQLGATGVAAHEVRSQTGLSVVWGPVRAADIPAFLDSGMKATTEMRRVRFSLGDRARLVGVEAAVLSRPWALAALVAALVAAALLWRSAPGIAVPLVLAAASAVIAVLAGAVAAPLLLPWIPGRMFSVKGAVVGAAAVAVLATSSGAPALWGWGLVAIAGALASYLAMNFTGASTYTSPSGVEWEMRRAIPAQVAAVVVGVALLVASAIVN
jgi:hypothetical protein